MSWLYRCGAGYVRGVETVPWAAAEAERLLRPLGRRWLHVCAVAELAEIAAPSLGLDGDLLVSSAWLHDIGYAPTLAETGFHPLDGARHLRRLRVDERIVALVARHSSAAHEAVELGLAAELDEEFPRWASEYHAALDYCDMTVGPSGERLTVSERIREVLERYERGTPVHRAMDRAAPELRRSVEAVERDLS